MGDIFNKEMQAIDKPLPHARVIFLYIAVFIVCSVAGAAPAPAPCIYEIRECFCVFLFHSSFGVSFPPPALLQYKERSRHNYKGLIPGVQV